MKIIHTADLHLDSDLRRHLGSDRARERRSELLNNFSRLVRYADEEGVTAILISGDLFDTARVSARARDVVLGEIREHPHIAFFYLKGNHDNEGILDGLSGDLENLGTFGDSWEKYRLKGGNVVICGVELTSDNQADICDSLELGYDDINIVMLHGQIAEHKAGDRAESINLSSLKNKNIDYLALGHVHRYMEGALPPRGAWVYPGCLEGRGMDEAGEHGFVLLDIDEQAHTYTKEFIPFAFRAVHEVSVDITEAAGMMDVYRLILDARDREDVRSRDYLHVILTGDVDAETEISAEQLARMLENDFYVVKITDATKVTVDYSAYRHDATLKGEFIRLLESEEDVPEEEKAEIIRTGLRLLAGEDIDL